VLRVSDRVAAISARYISLFVRAELTLKVTEYFACLHGEYRWKTSSGYKLLHSILTQAC